MLFRMFLAATLVVAVMLAVKDGRLLRDAGLTGSCSSIPAPGATHAYWQACKKGRLDGRPDLSRQGCKAVAVKQGLEWWRCPASLGSSRAASCRCSFSGASKPTYGTAR